MVRLGGIDNAGQEKCLTWELVAKDNHGPEIPCIAAIILANRHNQGCAFPSGARVCMGFLKLSDFEPEFARWGIKTQISERMT